MIDVSYVYSKLVSADITDKCVKPMRSVFKFGENRKVLLFFI